MGIYWPVVENMHEQNVRERFEAPHPDFEADIIIGDADSLVLATVTCRSAPKVMMDRKMVLPGEPVFFFSTLTRETNRKNSERDALAIVFSNEVRRIRPEKDLAKLAKQPALTSSPSTWDVGAALRSAFDKVYDLNEDELDTLLRDSPLWDEVWDLSRANKFLVLEPWIALSKLMGGQRVLNPGIDPREISITERTRDEMLVWFDKHDGG